MSAGLPRVRYEVTGHVAALTIDSPHNRNALSNAVLQGLIDGIGQAQHSADVRVILITAAGDVFSAGADLRDADADERPELLYRDLFEAIIQSPKPVVARVNGHAFGGAIGLVAACDVSITADESRFGFTEVRLGLAPTLASVTALPKLRPADATELLLTGARFDGRRAAELGLVNRSVSRDELDAEVDRVVDALLAGGPAAVAACKLLARRIPELDRHAAWAFTIEMSTTLAGTPEALEGQAAFFEKRSPNWTSP